VSDEAALLAAILAFPDEDTPRLIYADWLQEHGQEERAEFVRVQCELAKLPEPEEVTIFRADGGPVCKACMRVRGGSGLCRYHELGRRERELLRDWTRALLEPRPPGMYSFMGDGSLGWGTPSGDIPVEFRRGFVESLTCTAADWFTHGDTIRERHPVTRITLTTRPRLLEDADGALLLGDLRSLWIAWTEVAKHHSDDDPMPDRWLLAFLRCRWPGAEFEVPERVAGVDPASSEGDFTAMYEAGAAAAMQQEQAVMDAFLGADAPGKGLPVAGWLMEPVAVGNLRGMRMSVTVPGPAVTHAEGSRFGPVRGVTITGAEHRCRARLTEVVELLGLTTYRAISEGVVEAIPATNQAEFNAMVGGILEHMITQDGLLPGPDDEEDEDGDDEEGDGTGGADEHLSYP